MQVITLSPPLLQEASQRLAQHVVSSGFCPEVVIGVLNGGAQVARQMLDSLPAGACYCEVRMTRPSTSRKQASGLSRLPLWLCDLLRIMESRMVSMRSHSHSRERIGDLSLLSPTAEARLQQGPCRVLLIDDAIDTGATISKVREQLLSRYPQAEVRVAVLTVTTRHPLSDADYALYRNQTLCRFPWSCDYRE